MRHLEGYWYAPTKTEKFKMRILVFESFSWHENEYLTISREGTCKDFFESGYTLYELTAEDFFAKFQWF